MNKHAIYQIVEMVIKDVLPDINENLISGTKSLKDLGANSIDRMEVITMSLEKIGIKIPLINFAKVTNIEGIVDVLAENLR